MTARNTASQSLPDDVSNPFNVSETYLGPARKLDQITPHSLRMCKTLPSPRLVVWQ